MTSEKSRRETGEYTPTTQRLKHRYHIYHTSQVWKEDFYRYSIYREIDWKEPELITYKVEISKKKELEMFNFFRELSLKEDKKWEFTPVKTVRNEFNDKFFLSMRDTVKLNTIISEIESFDSSWFNQEMCNSSTNQKINVSKSSNIFIQVNNSSKRIELDNSKSKSLSQEFKKEQNTIRSIQGTLRPKKRLPPSLRKQAITSIKKTLWNVLDYSVEKKNKIIRFFKYSFWWLKERLRQDLEFKFDSKFIDSIKSWTLEFWWISQEVITFVSEYSYKWKQVFSFAYHNDYKSLSQKDYDLFFQQEYNKFLKEGDIWLVEDLEDFKNKRLLWYNKIIEHPLTLNYLNILSLLNITQDHNKEWQDIWGWYNNKIETTTKSVLTYLLLLNLYFSNDEINSKINKLFLWGKTLPRFRKDWNFFFFDWGDWTHRILALYKYCHLIKELEDQGLGIFHKPQSLKHFVYISKEKRS